MTLRGGAIAAAALLLTPSCGNAAREGEISCQRRLIALIDGALAPPRPPGEPEFATTFAAASRGFEQIPLEGCSEEQRVRARTMARAARDVANRAARVGDLRSALDQPSELQSGEAVMGLMDGIEQFQNRRRALREDLERMVRQSAD